MTLSIYRFVTTVLKPVLVWVLRRRLARGREDPVRIRERLGYPGQARPEGTLVWVHGSSVGEMVSVLPLIERILQQDKRLCVLVTSGTVTSARIMADRLPARSQHQYIPIDQPSAIDRFLDHWRPDLALWVESELWPNLINQTRSRDVPMAIINARMSEESFRRWRCLPFLIRPLLQSFHFCIAQSASDAERLRALGAHHVLFHGNLKSAAPPLSADPQDLYELKTAIGRRPCWVAASTHTGEDEIIGAAHRQLADQFPGLLTVLVPRHADRGDTVAKVLGTLGLTVAKRSQDNKIEPDTDIYLGDSMGEMGLFFRLSNVVFIGGSLVEHGGQNPLEAARLDCAILFGPYMFNFAEQAAALSSTGGGQLVPDGDNLADQVAVLLADDNETQRRSAAAAEVAVDSADVVGEVLKQIVPLLPGGEQTHVGA